VLVLQRNDGGVIMAKIYFVRHQAAGIVHEYPFASQPNAAQQAAVAKLCLQRFGSTHPKTKEEYWTTIVEVDLLGSDDVPVIPEQGTEKANVAGVGLVAVSGSMTVTPR